jgi:hypothetical protein
MRSSKAVVHDSSSTRSRDDPRRFGCGDRCDVNLIHHERFNDLRFSDRRDNFQQRFVGKNDRPFRRCVHISGKSQVRQVIDELPRKPAD